MAETGPSDIKKDSRTGNAPDIQHSPIRLDNDQNPFVQKPISETQFPLSPRDTVVPDNVQSDEIMRKQMHPAFLYDHYDFRQRMFALLPGRFTVFVQDENKQKEPVMHSKRKFFSLRDDYRIQDNDGNPVLTLKAPHIVNFLATHKVIDPSTQKEIGSLQYALRSIPQFKETWKIIGPDGKEIGYVQETSVGRSIISRFGVPRKYNVYEAKGKPVAQINEQFNPFVVNYRMDILDTKTRLDRRLLIASGMLIPLTEQIRRIEEHKKSITTAATVSSITT